MSSTLNRIILSVFLFKRNLGSIDEPIKNATNAIINVIVKLFESVFSDNSKKAENRNITINGLNIWFFNILFLFKKLKKFALGYNPLKKLFTHWSSINAKTVKIKVNKKDL